ncbi:hypothetical protein RKE29_02030 [Streptomyces sp. B1866]|uniref:hypothetical protein n=1 Tax=Streptomyces sp. B1866 TaxID=3075431 RepID=UPI00288CCBF1|nr:hypothetical protein [Streptomyces sp. B1866]MDT3395439.1 hypothetical protein [Streptomyces sp. B1866]
MAETIHVLGEGGMVFPMDLPLPEAIADRLAAGQLRRVNPDGTPYTDPATAAPAPAPVGGGALTRGETPRPGKNAAKSEWVAWAVAVHGLDMGEADGMTKQALAGLPEDPPSRAAPTAGRPDEDAPKAEWIAHVVSLGLLSAEDAANYTRQDLIDMAS